MTAYFVHERGICESENIGTGTRIWAFAHILPRAKIGADCNICDGVFVENDVTIGDRVTVKCGVQLWDGVALEDDVFVGPNATFSNDRFPRSKIRREEFLRTIVRKGASIGANATILPGIEIGPGSMIGAGAVVTRSVPANAIAVGNPASIVGYVNAEPAASGEATAAGSSGAVRTTATSVPGVVLYEFPWIKDMRGDLTVGEFARDLPFRPERYFMVFDVPSREVRGAHAHKTCHQFLIAVHGSCSILVDDGTTRREFLLDRPNLGVHVPPMIWGTQYKYSPDAVLLAFASAPYSADDYIRDYDEYLAAIGR